MYDLEYTIKTSLLTAEEQTLLADQQLLPQRDQPPNAMYAKNIMMPCPFCNLPAERILFFNPHGLVIQDGFPVSPGHTLVIPSRHVCSFFDLDPQERDALFALMDEAKHHLDREFKPAAYNIGINDGPAAGQTVPHLHIHLIPRYEGDQPDPRGGVRWVFPDKADYWSQR